MEYNIWFAAVTHLENELATASQNLHDVGQRVADSLGIAHKTAAGMVTDGVRQTIAWREAKAASVAAFQALRTFNQTHTTAAHQRRWRDERRAKK